MSRRVVSFSLFVAFTPKSLALETESHIMIFKLNKQTIKSTFSKNSIEANFPSS
jgi:hypothetical protein